MKSILFIISYVFNLVMIVNSISTCTFENSVFSSKCSGCPPKFNQKLCASTTRYVMDNISACGCNLHKNSYKFTAAANTALLNPNNPSLSWCPVNCGVCYEICTTGGSLFYTDKQFNKPGKCVIFEINDRCADGYKKPLESQYCRQEISPLECETNYVLCNKKKSTNNFGYSAHFDLQDINGQIFNDLQWDNPEITFVKVNCPFKNECVCKHRYLV
jgi:hypothetical protein